MAPVRKPSASFGDICKSVITNVATVRNFEDISEKFEEDQVCTLVVMVIMMTTMI
jgi:hypothetical protein